MRTFIPPIMRIAIPEHTTILIIQVMKKVAITMMRRAGGNFGRENNLSHRPLLEERGLNERKEKVRWLIAGLSVKVKMLIGLGFSGYEIEDGV